MICVTEMIWTFGFVYNIFKLVALESLFCQINWNVLNLKEM